MSPGFLVHNQSSDLFSGPPWPYLRHGFPGISNLRNCSQRDGETIARRQREDGGKGGGVKKQLYLCTLQLYSRPEPRRIRRNVYIAHSSEISSEEKMFRRGSTGPYVISFPRLIPHAAHGHVLTAIPFRGKFHNVKMPECYATVHRCSTLLRTGTIHLIQAVFKP